MRAAQSGAAFLFTRYSQLFDKFRFKNQHNPRNLLMKTLDRLQSINSEPASKSLDGIGLCRNRCCAWRKKLSRLTGKFA
jgi:hypothetical protein